MSYRTLLHVYRKISPDHGKARITRIPKANQRPVDVGSVSRKNQGVTELTFSRTNISISGPASIFQEAKKVADQKKISLSEYIVSLLAHAQTKSKVGDLIDDAFPKKDEKIEPVKPCTSHVEKNPEAVAAYEEFLNPTQQSKTAPTRCFSCSFERKDDHLICGRCGRQVNEDGSSIHEVTA